MAANGATSWSPRPPVADNVSIKPAGWRLVNFTAPSVRPRTDPQHLEHRSDPTPGWSAIQHDFELRLSRFGIKISETNKDSVSRTSNKPIRSVPSLSVAHKIIDGRDREMKTRAVANSMSTTEDFPPLEAPTVACFANSKKECRLEDVERQLRQAQTEAKIWKEKSEAFESDLHTSYRETMDWRMKYENLYSAVVQDRRLEPQGLRENREGTKSLG